MSDNVAKFYPADAAKDPDAVLEQAIGKFDQVLVLGWDKNGKFDGRASLGLKNDGKVLWLIEDFKFRLMTGLFEE